MHDHISEIDQQPTILRQALDPAALAKFSFDTFDCGICQGLQHPVAAARADDKILRKVGELVNVHQDDIFPLLIF